MGARGGGDHWLGGCLTEWVLRMMRYEVEDLLTRSAVFKTLRVEAETKNNSLLLHQTWGGGGRGS